MIAFNSIQQESFCRFDKNTKFIYWQRTRHFLIKILADEHIHNMLIIAIIKNNKELRI